MVVASIYGTSFIVLGSLAALWSLWKLIQAAATNPADREAEVEARQRVAEGGSWADENGSAPAPFTDAEIAQLSASLAPETPEEAGVDVSAKPPEKPKGLFNRR